ncbi:nuclear transport factor 2 family protein [Chryseobacterium gambrini]|uniref:nuclear transport factor 2 family protein n=1 Tax=Chryseobacterium gambrini TaxID=373672 RepID=UPI0022F1D54C|nr:nuclear transport factor 2 family protein [Chryseobacterium gambrini]WBV53878.1 nuclear transport factor 2 family protein [Chryseobacterium gambrini]
MKKIIFFLLSLSTAIACAQNKLNTKMEQFTINDEAEVLATVRMLGELMIARDTVAMNNILDEHYTLTHMTGYVQPKEEWFVEVSRESMKYYSSKEVNHTVKVNGNAADVVIQNLVDARIWGTRNTWRLQQKMKLEKRNGVWIILKSVASTF